MLLEQLEDAQRGLGAGRMAPDLHVLEALPPDARAPWARAVTAGLVLVHARHPPVRDDGLRPQRRGEPALRRRRGGGSSGGGRSANRSRAGGRSCERGANARVAGGRSCERRANARVGEKRNRRKRGGFRIRARQGMDGGHACPSGPAATHLVPTTSPSRGVGPLGCSRVSCLSHLSPFSVAAGINCAVPAHPRHGYLTQLQFW